MQLAPGIGRACISAVVELARSVGIRFSVALRRIEQAPNTVPRLGQRIATSASEWRSVVKQLEQGSPSLFETIQRAVARAAEAPEQREMLMVYFGAIVEKVGAGTPAELVSAIGTALDTGEQELVEGSANILTMHKAKGLSAEVVFIVGAEDEFLPGRNVGQNEGDERRLLYVSMTRARHRLYMTYCQRRTGQQRHLGSYPGRLRRSLTRFLRDSPLRAEPGPAYVLGLIRQ